MNNKAFNTLQKLGRTFMLPIALLPIAGLFLGLGAAFTNEALIANYGLQSVMGQGTFLNGIFTIMMDVGNVIFGNLALLFAIAVAFGLANDRQEVAALSAVVGYFVMYAALTSTMTAFLNMDRLRGVSGLIGPVLGFPETMNTGVFGGIILGLMVAYLHNKYYRVKFPEALSFFQGTHFIPIITTIAATILGIILAFVWPFVGMGIASLGQLIASSGAIGEFLYGFIYRALIPFGLHHVFYLPFWQTAVGGTAQVGGQVVQGAQNIVFAQIRAGVPVSPDAAKYFSFMFPLMIGGWPAAALAMYHSAPKERRGDIKGLLFGSSITSILTGITEPIEFTTLFASPFLFYGIHSVLAGFSVIMVRMLGAGVGLTFSGGIIDFIIYGILPGNDMTNWVSLILPIIIWALVYYFIFRFAISKFNLKTPGREGEDEKVRMRTKDEYRTEHGIGDSQTVVRPAKSEDELSGQILQGLGGQENLSDFTNCATRLRVTVNDGEKVDQTLLKSTGAAGIMQSGKSVQVIYGTKVEGIAGDLRDYLKGLEDNPDASQKVSEEPLVDSTQADVLKDSILSSPVHGQAVPLSEVKDQVFSTGMAGGGAGVIPSQGDIYSPVNGSVITVMESGHAIGLRGEDGTEVLIHVGIDTVELKGRGFDVKVEEGQPVKAGDLLIQADLEVIQKEGYDPTTLVIITNSEDFEKLSLIKEGTVNVGDEFISLKA